jgi:hypothetical protein
MNGRKWLIGALLVLAVPVVLLFPDLMRYLRIRRM